MVTSWNSRQTLEACFRVDTTVSVSGAGPFVVVEFFATLPVVAVVAVELPSVLELDDIVGTANSSTD